MRCIDLNMVRCIEPIPVYLELQAFDFSLGLAHGLHTIYRVELTLHKLIGHGEPLIQYARKLLFIFTLITPSQVSAHCFNSSEFEEQSTTAVIVNTAPVIVTAPVSLALSAVGFAADGIIYSTVNFGPAMLFCLSLGMTLGGSGHSMGSQAASDCIRVVQNAELNHFSYNSKGDYSSTIGKDIFEHTRDWRCPLSIIKD